MDWFPEYNYILASKSPRRKQLLESLGLTFQIQIKDVNETYPENLLPDEVALFLAEKKAEPFLDGLKENVLVITADTIVCQDGEILGKPENREDAVNMLNKLSGKEHLVITGVCLVAKKKKSSFFSSTRVFFKNLTDKEIDYYISNYKPFDKAGAYGIQGKAALFVQEIRGCYFNVMGFPLNLFYSMLKKAGIHENLTWGQ